MEGICRDSEKSVQVLQQKTELFESSATLQIKNNCERFLFFQAPPFSILNKDVVQPCEPLLCTDVWPEHEDQHLVSRTFIGQLHI